MTSKSFSFLIHSYIKVCFSYSLIDLFNVCTMLLNWTLHLLTPIQLFRLISIFFKSMFFFILFFLFPKARMNGKRNAIPATWGQSIGVTINFSIFCIDNPTDSHNALKLCLLPSQRLSHSLLPFFFLNIRTIIIVHKRFLLQFILYLQSQITPSKTFLILHEAFA